jgi:hypothetical protein
VTDLVKGLQQVIQDVGTPDLKAILSRQQSFQKQLEVQYDALLKTIEAFARKCAPSLLRFGPIISSKFCGSCPTQPAFGGRRKEGLAFFVLISSANLFHH